MYLWLSSETSCFQSPTASLSPGLLCTAVMFRTPGWGKESWFCSHSGAPSRPISGNGCCSLISPKASYGPSRIIHWSITSPLNASPLDPSHLWMSQHPKTTIHPPLKLSQREMVSFESEKHSRNTIKEQQQQKKHLFYLHFAFLCFFLSVHSYQAFW